MTDALPLAEAIQRLREQLGEAERQGASHDLKFVTKSIELELSIVLKRELEAGTSVRAWFVDLSGKAKAADEAAHKLKLVLEPRRVDGKTFEVGSPDHEQ